MTATTQGGGSSSYVIRSHQDRHFIQTDDYLQVIGVTIQGHDDPPTMASGGIGSYCIS
jgi:hypothetical protein